MNQISKLSIQHTKLTIFIYRREETESVHLDMAAEMYYFLLKMVELLVK